MTVVRVVEMPTCRVTDSPMASMRATAVREVRVGLRVALEVESRAVGPSGRNRSPNPLMSHGTYNGVAIRKASDRQAADRTAQPMIPLPCPVIATTEVMTPITVSREQMMIRASPTRRFCSTVGTGRSASRGATRVARSAGRKAARTVMTMPMKNSMTMSFQGHSSPKAKAPV